MSSYPILEAIMGEEGEEEEELPPLNLGGQLLRATSSLPAPRTPITADTAVDTAVDPDTMEGPKSPHPRADMRHAASYHGSLIPDAGSPAHCGPGSPPEVTNSGDEGTASMLPTAGPFALSSGAGSPSCWRYSA